MLNRVDFAIMAQPAHSFIITSDLHDDCVHKVHDIACILNRVTMQGGLDYAKGTPTQEVGLCPTSLAGK